MTSRPNERQRPGSQFNAASLFEPVPLQVQPLSQHASQRPPYQQQQHYPPSHSDSPHDNASPSMTHPHSANDSFSFTDSPVAQHSHLLAPWNSSLQFQQQQITSRAVSPQPQAHAQSGAPQSMQVTQSHYAQPQHLQPQSQQQQQQYYNHNDRSPLLRKSANHSESESDQSIDIDEVLSVDEALAEYESLLRRLPQNQIDSFQRRVQTIQSTSTMSNPNFEQRFSSSKRRRHSHDETSHASSLIRHKHNPSVQQILSAIDLDAVRSRFQILATLMLLQSFSSVIMSHFETLIQKHVFISTFLTMLVGSGQWKPEMELQCVCVCVTARPAAKV